MSCRLAKDMCMCVFKWWQNNTEVAPEEHRKKTVRDEERQKLKGFFDVYLKSDSLLV